MSTSRLPEAHPHPIGAPLLESVRRFYLELLSTARAHIHHCQIRDLASSRDDVAQEAICRLLTRAPRRWQDQAPPLSVLKAWVRKTARRLCVDMARKAERRGEHAAGDWSQIRAPLSPAKPAHAPLPRERLETTQLAREALTVLREAYPRGADLAERVMSNPDLTTAELAELFGTSPANVHQIRTRMRRVLRGAKVSG